MQTGEVAKVLVLDDSLCDLHTNGTSPEIGERTSTIRKAIQTVQCEILSGLQPISLSHPSLLAVHKPKYVEQLFNLCRKETNQSFGLDVWFCGQDSEMAIRIAAGAGITAVDALSLFNFVFCNVRPPGHHAKMGMARGFCFLNNVCIAAHYAATEKQMRVCIVDWDVHHGNGTRDICDKVFTGLPILFCNIQEYERRGKFYPGTGKEKHSEKYHSFNLFAGQGDDEMKDIFSKMCPIITDFKPDLIIISCGFDAHKKDDISNIGLSDYMYGWMTRQLFNLCPNIVSMLEGGYNLQVLEQSIKFHLEF